MITTGSGHPSPPVRDTHDLLNPEHYRIQVVTRTAASERSDAGCVTPPILLDDPTWGVLTRRNHSALWVSPLGARTSRSF